MLKNQSTVKIPKTVLFLAVTAPMFVLKLWCIKHEWFKLLASNHRSQSLEKMGAN